MIYDDLEKEKVEENKKLRNCYLSEFKTRSVN
jgi:hypothetical protein